MGTRTRDTERTQPRDSHEQSGDGSSRTDSNRTKRAAVAVLGGTLLVRGLRRRSVRGAAMAAVGGWLLSRALGGRERLRRTLPSQSVLGSESETQPGTAGAAEVSRSVIVGESADDLYEIWRDPDRLSEIMGHFAEISEAGEDRLRWTVDGPAGRDVSWETRFVTEQPGEFLHWEAVDDVMVATEGRVRFSPAAGDRGTEVTLTVTFDPPGGSLGQAALERLGVVPEALVGTALGRFKSLAESGEIPTLEDNPSARGRGDLL